MTTFRRPDASPIPTDGLAAVVRAGRRRRAVGAGSGSAVLAGLAVVLLAGPTSGSHSLRPIAPSTDPSPSSTSSPESPGATATAEPTAGPTASPAPGETATAEPTATGPAPEPTVSPEPAGHGGQRYAHHDAMSSGNGVMAPLGRHTGDGQIWYVDGAATPGSGTPKPYTLKVTICSSDANSGLQSLDFATTQEADFAVVDGSGAEAWRWSRGQHFAASRHTTQVASGQCVWWSTTWLGVDDSGYLLPDGKYTVRMYSTADGWDEPVVDVEVTVGS